MDDTTTPTASSASTSTTSGLPAPESMAYARIEVPDIEASVAWYEYHVGLAVTGGHGDRVFLRHGLDHHSIELVPAPERTASWTTGAGFTVRSPEVLAGLHERAVAAGCTVGPLEESVKGLCTEGFSVTDPDGFVIELLYQFQTFAVPPDQVIQPRKLVHPFMSTPNFEASYEFYTQVLGFRASDHIVGSTSFLRCDDRYHHSMALRRDDSFYVAHLCFMMASFDDVMKRRARANYKHVPIASDMMNHSASGSIAFYMLDEQHGPRIELCDNHVVFSPEQHDLHEARHLALDPRNIDIWRAAADDWERF